MKASTYPPEYYSSRHDRTLNSARLIMAHVLDGREVNSIIDFGCGVGTFLHVSGVEDVLGIDMHNDMRSLRIPERAYMRHNLEHRLVHNRKFDMAICVEVAEHLPESAARTLCESISGVSDLVLWSAATLGQGGVNHINEQPMEYWCDIWKSLGYCQSSAPHAIRRLVGVLPWYRHNLMFYTRCE